MNKEDLRIEVIIRGDKMSRMRCLTFDEFAQKCTDMVQSWKGLCIPGFASKQMFRDLNSSELKKCECYLKGNTIHFAFHETVIDENKVRDTVDKILALDIPKCVKDEMKFSDYFVYRMANTKNDLYHKLLTSIRHETWRVISTREPIYSELLTTSPIYWYFDITLYDVSGEDWVEYTDKTAEELFCK